MRIKKDCKDEDDDDDDDDDNDEDDTKVDKDFYLKPV